MVRQTYLFERLPIHQTSASDGDTLQMHPVQSTACFFTPPSEPATYAARTPLAGLMF